ncbi:Gp138 family membrane-puncturing spike protein [Desulfovibrio cuneatus]|uniref:Gp138 family membrane-puncturing spike protein n=1 Tax=Desulfovibrio cuneatus TaxID=159728 RepID=UPI0003FAFBD5|nr:Gp138 family membrane-puncturing spike protein [Desulfovibrio cuneatus]
MDRRERTHDAVEAMRVALDGRQLEMWTALPGLVNSFNPAAMTVSVQPAIKGWVQQETGKVQEVNLPLLVDVPVVFPCGGGFSLTHPVKKDDECLVVFASRCIDGWWQGGGIGSRPDERMHDLSDGFAIVGPRSQPRVLDPAVDTDNVQLRTDDGKAHITMMPDYTIRSQNPACVVLQTPDGTVTAQADKEINLVCPKLNIQADSISITGKNGSKAATTFTGDINQTGSHRSTGDQIAGGVSQINHPHRDAGGTGPCGPPIAG